MGPMKMMGVGLVVVLAIGAVASASASAEPEFLTKAVVGEAAPSSVPFTATIGPILWEGAVSKGKITCFAGSATGEVTGPKSNAGVVMTLTGCETGGGKAHSAASRRRSRG